MGETRLRICLCSFAPLCIATYGNGAPSHNHHRAEIQYGRKGSKLYCRSGTLNRHGCFIPKQLMIGDKSIMALQIIHISIIIDIWIRLKQ